jgi:Zn-dependent protease
MLQELLTNPFSFLIWIVALLVAITIHEFSHALAADRLGDPTPRLEGRLTLNPLAHLDPIGTLMLLIARFGWGKPVPIDPYNLQNPRRDAAIISLAGPGSNFILAIILSIILRLSLLSSFGLLAISLLTPIIVLNVYLGLFNLLPVAPLDGFKIVLGFLPHDLALQWEELESYGLIFLLFLIFPFGGRPLISTILSPIINLIFSLLLPGPTLI